MYPNSLETTHRLATLKANDCLAEAEALRLLKACRSEGQQSWLKEQVCASLCAVGRMLVATGQRLQRFEGAPVRNVQAF